MNDYAMNEENFFDLESTFYRKIRVEKYLNGNKTLNIYNNSFNYLTHPIP